MTQAEQFDIDEAALHESFGHVSKFSVETPASGQRVASPEDPAAAHAALADTDAIEESFGARGRPSYFDDSVDQAIEESFASQRRGRR